MASVSSPSKGVKSGPRPVTGSCRWLRRLVLGWHSGLVSITSHTKAGPVTHTYEVGARLALDGPPDAHQDAPAQLAGPAEADAPAGRRGRKAAG